MSKLCGKLYGELLRRHIQTAESAELWVDIGSWCSSASGATLPNDEEISQLTEGGKLEERQEPELTTPEIPRELIGYEWISDSDDSDGEDYPWRIKQMDFWWGQLSSGVARAFSGRRLAHPEDQNEEENK